VVTLEMVLEQVKIALLEEALTWLLAGYIELGSLALLSPLVLSPGELSVKDLMLQQAES
jgi:hypothetical protein